MHWIVKYILDNFTSVKIIENDKKYLDHTVYELNTLDDEVRFIFDKVMLLLKDEVSPSSIYFTNVTDEYLNTIKKYSYFYNVPVSLNLSFLLSTTVMFKTSFNVLKETKSFESALSFINAKYDLENDENMNIYKKIISLFNKYNKLNYSFDKILEAIKYNSEHIEKEDTFEGIKVCSLSDNIFCDNDYVFLMGFNRGVIPLIHKDEEFISDNIKEGTLLELVKDLNKIEKSNLLNKITSIKNLTMSYKLKNKDEEYFTSTFAQDNFKIVKANISYDYSYSKTLSSIYLASLLDELIKYDKKDTNLDKYYNSFNIPYREYDNSYKKIDKEMLLQYLNNKLVLSYSSLDNYFKCGFKYYVENVLNLNKFEETFEKFVGNLFHYVLKNFYNDDFDLEKEYDNYIKNKTFSLKEKFYLKKLKKELKIICDRLNDFESNTEFKNVLRERKIEIEKNSDIEVIFKGFVDKIMYLEKKRTLVSIIDYKTGSASLDVGNIYYGFDMQLFIYLYLISKSNLFDNPFFTGFYIQKILSGEVNIEKNKTYLAQKYKNLNLTGYSTSDTYYLEKFDKTYENSEFIKGMKCTKDGFYKYTKVLNEEEMNSITSFIDKKIDYARDNILDANFNINPKKYKDEKDVTSCKFCKYRDLCFRKNEQIENIDKIKTTDFLKEV